VREAAAIDRFQSSVKTRLHEFSTQLIEAGDTEALYEQILDTAIAVMRSQFASLQILDASRGLAGELRLLGHRGFSAEAAAFWEWVRPSHASTCGIALRTLKRVFASDVDTCEEMAGSDDLATYRLTGIRAVQTTPLFSRTGTLLGMISTHWCEPHQPDAHNLELFDVLARQAAHLIERRQSEDALQQAAARDAFRVRLGDALRATSDPTEVKSTAARILAEHLRANRVLYLEVADGEVVIGRDDATGVASLAGRHPVDTLGTSLVAEFRAGRTVAASNVTTEPPFGDPAIRTYIGVPLMRDGAWVAAVVACGIAPRTWTPQDITLIEDTAERTWSAVERARAEAALRDADRNKDMFLAMLAHELRNPLAPLRTSIEVLRQSAYDPAVINHTIAIMERQTEHMVRLVDDLLDASRITQGKIVLQRSPTQLVDVVNLAIETNHALIQQAQIELVVRIPEEPCVLDVDATRIVQVASNLLHNAAKFTPSHGRIDLAADVRGGELELVVADTGAGIPAELLSRIFTLFAQGEPPKHRGKEGLGIGLALARHIVELHGGTIEARSDGPGRGSRFHVYLPVLAGATAPEPSARSTEPAPKLERRHVVIIDDNHDAANALAMLVRANGGYPHVAYDGATGLECVRTVRPHLVLLDIGMPDLDGYEVCRRIRQEPFGREVVLIAMSGWGRAEDKQHAMTAGFTAHLTKPADPAEICRYL
jgi:signal transduction histidine kinase/CheY-like chemotaxis protein